ncbi:MAG: 16S rRNA (guanine(966)-N(2))-methyltransferase RsmD [Candidatus Omnitrophica bacterium]|nr:16S rRNA (guanine(966)-N(2))-methyltransferase RsmD [Candidatus Omnitrophota bacterium]
MRIIAGTLKNRRLKVSSKRISPTKDIVKESLFNILKDRIKGSLVLDLFSGSGSLGLEALSRGAQKVTMVDREISDIKKNIAALAIEDSGRIEIHRKDVFRYIKKYSKKSVKFDIIFVDPPYDADIAKKCLIILSDYAILCHDGLIIVEHKSSDKLSRLIGIFELTRRYQAGKTSVSFYKKEKRVEKTKSCLSGNL